jgi:hypothetical protein
MLNCAFKANFTPTVLESVTPNINGTRHHLHKCWKYIYRQLINHLFIAPAVNSRSIAE